MDRPADKPLIGGERCTTSYKVVAAIQAGIQEMRRQRISQGGGPGAEPKGSCNEKPACAGQKA